MLDEHGKEMHGSWGNMIDAEDAFARMGADVMRWQYCAQPPDRNLLFGFGPAQEIKGRLLTLWNSAKFLADYGAIESFRPTYADLGNGGPDADLQPLDRWLVERTAQLVDEAQAGYERWLTVDVTRAFDAYVDDLSNWYIRRSRRRFWDGDETALRTLWFGLVQGLRVIAPVMPFLAEHLWQALVADVVEDAPASVFLAGWPEVRTPDARLLAEVAELRTVVALGHRARSAAGLKLRQPLRRIVVEGAPLAAAHADEISEELRVKEVELGHVDAELRVKPHLPALGPKLGKELGAVRAALQAGDFEDLGGGRFRAAGHELGPDEVHRRARRQGGLGGRRGRRGHGGDRDRGRRRAGARGPGLRADPPGQLDAQGRRARAHRPDRADAAGRRRRPARALDLDRARDPGAERRHRRRSTRRRSPLPEAAPALSYIVRADEWPLVAAVAESLACQDTSPHS